MYCLEGLCISYCNNNMEMYSAENVLTNTVQIKFILILYTCITQHMYVDVNKILSYSGLLICIVSHINFSVEMILYIYH